MTTWSPRSNSTRSACLARRAARRPPAPGLPFRRALALGDVAVSVGGWLVNGAENLAGAIADVAKPVLLAGWDAAGRGYDAAVKIGKWAVGEVTSGQLLTDAGNLINSALSALHVDFQQLDADDQSAVKRRRFACRCAGSRQWRRHHRGRGPSAIDGAATASNDQSLNAYQTGLKIGRNIHGNLIKGILFPFYEVAKFASPAVALVVGLVQGIAEDIGKSAYNGTLKLASIDAGDENSIVSQVAGWVASLPGKLVGGIDAKFSGLSGVLNTASQGSNTAGVRLHNFIVGKITDLWNFKSDVSWSDLLKPLDAMVQGASDALSGWLNGVGDKILGALGLGGGANGGTPSVAAGIVGLTTGKKSDPGSIITDAIKGLFNFDFSGLHLPSLPNFSTVLEPLQRVASATNKVADDLQAAWDKLQKVLGLFKDANTQVGSGGASVSTGSSGGFTPGVAGIGGGNVITGASPLFGGLNLTNLRNVGDGFAADGPPLTITIPLSTVFNVGGNADPMARNKSEAPMTVTTTMLADDTDVKNKFAESVLLGSAWAASSLPDSSSATTPARESVPGRARLRECVERQRLHRLLQRR